MDKRLIKILVFLQKLQIEVSNKMYSYGVNILRHNGGVIVSYHYQKKENSRMCCRSICGSFHRRDCRDLGDSLKDIRAFLKKA